MDYEKILEYLNSNKGKAITAKKIAKGTKANWRYIANLMRTIAKNKGPLQVTDTRPKIYVVTGIVNVLHLKGTIKATEPAVEKPFRPAAQTEMSRNLGVHLHLDAIDAELKSIQAKQIAMNFVLQDTFKLVKALASAWDVLQEEKDSVE